MTDLPSDAVERFAAEIELALRELRADVAPRQAAAVAPVLDVPPVPVAPVDVPAEPHVRTRRSARRRLGTVVLSGLVVIAAVVVLASTVGPLVLPYRTYFVRSGSMAPTIPTGAMVVVTEADPSRLGPGDIIVFARPGDASVTVTHRIVSVDATAAGPAFVTKGDGNATVDPWVVPVRGVRWEHRFHVPLVGYVFGFLGTPAARWALVVVPVAVLVALAVSRRAG